MKAAAETHASETYKAKLEAKAKAELYKELKKKHWDAMNSDAQRDARSDLREELLKEEIAGLRANYRKEAEDNLTTQITQKLQDQSDAKLVKATSYMTEKLMKNM